MQRVLPKRKTEVVLVSVSTLESGVQSTRSLETPVLTRRTVTAHIVFVPISVCKRSRREMNIEGGQSVDIQGVEMSWEACWPDRSMV